MKDFVHLHVHSQYSILDGQASIPKMVDKAIADGMRGMALTDHGNMMGIKDFFNYTEKVISKAKKTLKELNAKLSEIESGAYVKSSEEEIQAMVDVFDGRRKKLISFVDGIAGVTAIEPDGAFYVMLDVGGLYGKRYQGKMIDGSVQFADVLLDAVKVATVPGVSFGADDCVRLSYALGEEEMLEGLARIKAFVESLE